MEANHEKEDVVNIDEEENIDTDDEKKNFVSKAEFEDLKKECEEYKSKAEEYINLAKRVQADFENYKKRNKNAMSKMYEDTLFNVVNDFLPVLDNIERAIETGKNEKWPKAVVDGIEKIAKQYEGILASKGIVEIKCMGEKFDPNLHDAVMTVDRQEDQEENIIVEVLQKGYIKDEKVVRHSIVKVAN
ncbi:MAG: nucleotide exchange factor GrpE [Clostridia bacterium]|nr:nucleotide exchange factor GrpE [Clostridia bacterium]